MQDGIAKDLMRSLQRSGRVGYSTLRFRGVTVVDCLSGDVVVRGCSSYSLINSLKDVWSKLGQIEQKAQRTRL